MKERFEAPEMELVTFDAEDVIRTSGVIGDNELPDDDAEG